MVVKVIRSKEDMLAFERERRALNARKQRELKEAYRAPGKLIRERRAEQANKEAEK